MGIVRDLYYARKMSAGLKLPAPTVALLIKRLRLAAAMGGGGVEKTVSGTMVHITDALAKTALSVLASIAPIQPGSGDPAPDNVRPISGLTGLSVYRTGKNLIDPAKKAIAIGSPTTARWYNDGTGFLLHSGQAYTLSANVSTDATYYVYIYAIGGTQLSYGKWTATYTPSADVYVYFQYYESGGAHLADAELQLELGSSATTYESFNGNTYAVDWSTQAGTVYGGTLDVVTGQLTVDSVSVNLNPAAKSENASGYFWYTTASALGIDAISGLNAGLLCNRLAAISNISQTSAEGKIVFFANGIIRWKEQGSLALADYSTYLASNPLQIVYELATPLTYQLSAQEVQMLLGENYLWSSSGDSLSVTYYAEGNANNRQALNILLGDRYSNPGTPDDVSDKEALDIILGR